MGALGTFFYGPLKRRGSALVVFGVHLTICIFMLVIGGFISSGTYIYGLYAFSDALRYMGYLFSFFLGLVYMICLFSLRGGILFNLLWFIEWIAYALQFLAWIFDAVDSASLRTTPGPNYGFAVCSALFGFFASLYTLWVAIGLFRRRNTLATLCGGKKDFCGIDFSKDDDFEEEKQIPAETAPPPVPPARFKDQAGSMDASTPTTSPGKAGV